jgi:tetratricopeptide (TPR) repeat protein
MDRHSKIGAFLITILGLLALTLVYLVVRGLTVKTPSDLKKTEPFEVARVESSPEGIRPDPDSGTVSVSIEWGSPFTAPEAQPLAESGDLLTKQLNEEGLALYTRGDYQAAADRFSQALERNPGSPVLRQNLAYAKGSHGWQLIESGQYQDALFAFQEAVDLSTASGRTGGADDSAFYMGMGLVYYRLKQEDRAIEMLKTAIERRSDYAEPYKLLGEIYSLRDEMEMAVGYLEKAAELDPNDLQLRQRIVKAQRERNTQGAFQQQATLHFTVKFEGREERDVAARIIDLLEEAYREIGQALSTFPQNPVTVILYSNQQFRDVTLTPSWSKGLFDGKIRLPIEGSGKDLPLLRKVVYHEYTHAVIYELSKGHIPTWLNEGIALNLEGDSVTRWEEILLNHIKQGRGLIPLSGLHESFMSFSDDRAALAYAESYSATRYLIDRYGLYRIRELLALLSVQSEFNKAFEDRLFTAYSEFERDWSRQIERRAHEGT